MLNPRKNSQLKNYVYFLMFWKVHNAEYSSPPISHSAHHTSRFNANFIVSRTVNGKSGVVDRC